MSAGHLLVSEEEGPSSYLIKSKLPMFGFEDSPNEAAFRLRQLREVSEGAFQALNLRLPCLIGFVPDREYPYECQVRKPKAEK